MDWEALSGLYFGGGQWGYRLGHCLGPRGGTEFVLLNVPQKRMLYRGYTATPDVLRKMLLTSSKIGHDVSAPGNR